MTYLIYIFAILIGILTGGITSLIGASGVMVIVPVLTMFFHISAHVAIGTSLFVDVIASIVVSYNYFKNGNVDIKSGIWIAVSSIAGAQLGAFWASYMKEGTLSGLFGIVLIVSGMHLFIKSNAEKAEKSGRPVRFPQKWQRITLSVLIGIGIGILSGLFGAGGGVMILLALVIIMAYPMHKAIGTSTLIMAMTALSSMSGYVARGNIDYPLGCLLAAGAVIGGIIGARFANKICENILQKFVSIFFAGLGVAMTISVFVK